jgi:hypothetical protein
MTTPEIKYLLPLNINEQEYVYPNISQEQLSQPLQPLGLPQLTTSFQPLTLPQLTTSFQPSTLPRLNLSQTSSYSSLVHNLDKIFKNPALRILITFLIPLLIIVSSYIVNVNLSKIDISLKKCPSSGDRYKCIWSVGILNFLVLLMIGWIIYSEPNNFHMQLLLVGLCILLSISSIITIYSLITINVNSDLCMSNLSLGLCKFSSLISVVIGIIATILINMKQIKYQNENSILSQ